MNKLKPGLIILTILIPLSLFGQFEIGVKAGVNLNNIKTTNISQGNPDFNSIIGFHVGLFTQFDIRDKFHINSDLLYSRRGFELGNYKTSIDYLEIPILISYSVLDKLEIELGPNVGLKLSYKSDIPWEYESIDFGLTAGLRYKLTDKFLLSGRYYHGLTSIATLFAGSLSGGSESKSFNRVAQFTLGYRLNKN